jgi:DNA (cytosine-5)-methyltransferase 1
MKSIELFTGAGGLALGISKAGFRHMGLIEVNQYACDTITENQRKGTRYVDNWPLFQSDVRNIDYSLFGRELDLVAGGPPCQPFSLGGKHRAYDDERDMFPEAVRAVRALMPKAFLFENVKGLARRAFSNYVQYIYFQLTYPELQRRKYEAWDSHLARLDKHHTSKNDKGLHYKVLIRLKNAVNYGVPQKRERLFFVGFRCDIAGDWSFPIETHSEESLVYDKWCSNEYWERHRIPVKNRPPCPDEARKLVSRLHTVDKPKLKAWKTIRDSISDLPKPRCSENPRFLNHRLVMGARPYSGHTGSRLDQPAKTLKAGVHGVPGGENMISYEDGSVRYFTIREAARIQTFPDDFVFHGSWSETMRQLGNAVPVDLATVIAESIHSRLEDSSNS